MPVISPLKATKALVRQPVLRSEMDVFKANLIVLLDKINTIDQRPKDESEEHLKNDLRDFLRDTYYRGTHAINTKDKKDLVIHTGKSTDSDVGVIVEAKRPTNVAEMISADNFNKKALHELVLYYLDERSHVENTQLKHLIITNINEWYVIDANEFDKHIYRNTQIRKLYETKINDRKDNPFFYEEIAKIIAKTEVNLDYVYFNIKDYQTPLRNQNPDDDHRLTALYKLLSPAHLLKVAAPNDANSLNERFYKELLHIIGLEETKDGGKSVIRRKTTNRHAASLLEAAIDAIETEDVLHRVTDGSAYGATVPERTFAVALELCITWINRILFLKLLEGQLMGYHQGDKKYLFLNLATINDFDELFKLFHKVLAVNIDNRTEAIKTKYGHVPYLNSSLFDISELEDQTIKINALDNGGIMPLIKGSVLTPPPSGGGGQGLLSYLFQFLDAYDFASEGATVAIQDDNRTIINASVLGKVFEKINGYKDGSIYTPAFITMYMCRQTIRQAIIQKFSPHPSAPRGGVEIAPPLGAGGLGFTDIYNLIGSKISRKEANDLINTLKVCDPAVGSGHFLVSALNEIITIKSELGILMDENGKLLRDYEVSILNDELVVTDIDGQTFVYNPNNKESTRVQKTLFHEKQTIIENCLFGVDINPNSVKICRLRLWIELLKNAYYSSPAPREGAIETPPLGVGGLQTLPNIDINIKCGNSLLSRFALDADLSKALRSIKYDVAAYRGFVNDYKNEKNRDAKRGLTKIIDSIKADFKTEINKNDKKLLALNKLSGELYNLTAQTSLLPPTPKEAKVQQAVQARLETDINKLSAQIDDIKNNTVYRNAFEWRFEFPEVLNDNGDFVGFDVVIGNPPYVDYRELGSQQTDVLKQYKTSENSPRPNLYQYFIEQGYNILKQSGYLCYINPNQFLSIDAGYGIRKFIVENTIIQFIDDVSNIKVFDKAATYTIVWCFKKEKNGNYPVRISKCNNPEDIGKASLTVRKNDIIANGKYLIIANVNQLLINKIEREKVKLGELSNMIWGTSQSGYGQKKIKKDSFEQLLDSEKTTYKPIIQTRDIKNYVIDWKGEYIPAELFSTNAIKRFDESEKIVVARMTLRLQAAIDFENRYVGKSTIIFDVDKRLNKRYLLSILNSKVINFWYSNYFENTHLSGGYMRFDIPYLKKIPTLIATPAQQQPIIDLVDAVLLAKRDGRPSDTFETQIDELVYELYGITAEERAVIEGK